ncbi:MAG: TIGR02301 family protein [Alphaproteobacteria bacterium]
MLSGNKLGKNPFQGSFVRRAALIIMFLTIVAGIVPARAVDPLYETKLIRLAEVLGSIHSLRNLCGENSSQWRDRMDSLLVTENPDPVRKARLIASFNRGYRTFNETYSTCTSQAIAAIDRYKAEGTKLSSEIVSGYGN